MIENNRFVVSEDRIATVLLFAKPFLQSVGQESLLFLHVSGPIGKYVSDQNIVPGSSSGSRRSGT